jgi:hypothetical protein
MMTKVQKLDNPQHRAALAVAIEGASSARKNLEIARTAFTNSENKVNEAYGKLDALREVAPANASPDAMLETLAAGSDFDIHTLAIPGAEARAREEKAERDLTAWRDARAVAEKAIPDRKDAVADSDREIAKAAHVVIGSTFDIGKLLSDAEAAQAAVVEKRTRLIYLRSLDLGDEAERHAIAQFLSHQWLLHEGSEAWKYHPVVTELQAAHEALLLDSSAPLPA